MGHYQDQAPWLYLTRTLIPVMPKAWGLTKMPGPWFHLTGALIPVMPMAWSLTKMPGPDPLVKISIHFTRIRRSSVDHLPVITPTNLNLGH
jgi:hypothetical protein